MSDDGTQRGHSRSRWFKRVKPNPIPGTLWTSWFICLSSDALGHFSETEVSNSLQLWALIESMWFCCYFQGTREPEAMVWFFCRQLWKPEVWWSCKLYSENDLLRESLWRNCEEAMRKAVLPWTILFVRFLKGLSHIWWETHHDN